ncbi:MAG: threonine--tRNA ligase [Pseudomonadota bacterium]
MLTIRLPDGSVKKFEQAVSVADVAADIGSGLARAAVAARVDGRPVDLSYVIERDAELSIITGKDEAGLEVIRHSTAHLLAQAVKRLFPKAQVTIGPVIDDGFYYDFAFERAFNEEDLQRIEKEMQALAKQNFEVKRFVMKRDEAISFFREKAEFYKAEIIEDLPEDEVLSLYQQGDFVDLCRGPHVPNTGKLKAFKLMKVAGAYWRGDSNNDMLQRIYGTAWANKDDLNAYLHRLEEAEKRDHRKLAKQMDLFHLQEEAPGMVFWHDQGWQLYQVIEQYIRRKLRAHDYQEIKTPQLVDSVLWEKSGHWQNYRDEMFITESEKRLFAVKPMSCPCHVQVFKQGLKSYRDLPLRMAEFGNCHRNEPSGTLHGLMRVRNFVQDDAHIFCTEAQIQSEAQQFIRLILDVYRDFGLDDLMMALSTRPEKRVGDDALWDKAESDLKRALDTAGVNWSIKEGDGAFYGPKIDFSVRDCLNRVWQLGTLQLDYCLPARLKAEYIAEDGGKKTPVMLHRAIIGSFERFIGILLEHYAGKLPLWLAPTQVVVLNISEHQADYARQVADQLKKSAIRVKLDLRNEKIGFKIRQFALERVSYLVIIGDREMQEQQIAVRTQAGENLGSMTMPSFLRHLQEELGNKQHINE